jgi:CheY-like chemotaxis protein/two-component sensor histidine kinase
VTLGKIELTREPLLLSEILSRAAEANRTAIAGAGLRFDLRIDSAPMWVDGDVTRLEQVLSNLLSNAVKFTPRGGTVTLTAAREGDRAVIRVRDNGTGIDPALLPRIFDLFVQGDTSLARAKSGLGIGLALVRKLIQLHGGEVTVTSAGGGQGAEFVVSLPMSKVDRVPPAEDVVPSWRPLPRLRVLVVDDQRDVADAIAMLIEHVGHDSQAVYDGDAALARARSTRPDVIFVDVGMPGMTGYELAGYMRADPSLAGVMLVALTGYGRAEDRARALASGFDVHVTKPLTENRLREVLAGHAKQP